MMPLPISRWIPTLFRALAFLVLLASVSTVKAAPTPAMALDVEMFKRELERSHAFAAKKERNFRKHLKTLEKMTEVAPGFPGPWMALAQLEARAGNLRRASEDHLEALRRSDRWAGPALSYASFLSDHGKNADAVALLRTALSTQPGNEAISFALAEALQRSEPDSALSLWDSLVKADPDRTDAAFRAAALEFSRGRWAEARERLKVLHASRPGDPEVLTLYADATRKAGRQEEALVLLEKLAIGTADCGNMERWVEEVPKDALAACRKALERHPRCAGVLVRKASALESAGELEEAFRTYADAYRLEPEDKTLRSRIKVLAGRLLKPVPDPGPTLRSVDRANRWAKASSEMSGGNWRKAFAAVKVIPFREDQEFRQSFLFRMAEAAKGDEELMLWADSLARNIPREGGAIYAAALKGSGRIARADELLRKAVESWPLDPEPCERLGKMRAEVRLWDAALKAYEEADRRDWRGRWILEEAHCAREKGDWGKSARKLIAELARRPLHAEAYQGLTMAYEKNGMGTEALQAARLWAQTDPLSREAWEAYRRMLGDSDPALQGSIERIVKLLQPKAG